MGCGLNKCNKQAAPWMWEEGELRTVLQRWSLSSEELLVQLLLVRSCCFWQLHAFHLGFFTKDILPPNVLLVPILVTAARGCVVFALNEVNSFCTTLEKN